MNGAISYLRTAAEVKSFLGLGFKKVIEILKQEKVRVRLQPFMQQLLVDKKNDKAYLKRINERIMRWQASRDTQELPSAVLLYHHSGARALHGFRYHLIPYEKKDREQYKNQRNEFSRKERGNWLKKIAVTHRDELVEAGFSEKQIDHMKIMGRAPIGYEVHHRLALDDGGTNEDNNLILIRNDVEHRSIHGYYNPGELQIKLLSIGEKIPVALPIPPENAVVYPNPARGYFSARIPNSTLVELYDVD